ncbi:MAG: biotin--[acetyl-CoA-carboxylase] ligase [Pseudomonadota bacterium]
MTVWPAGTGLEVFDEIDSTLDEARRRADAGETGPLWIAAHRQTKGRGRQGRAWSSEPGNLAATGLFRFDGPPAEAAKLSFATALAVADTTQSLAPAAIVRLKWPNDVLVNGGKASGILLESYGKTSDGQLLLAIGIGINLAHHPDPQDAAVPPTCLKDVTGVIPDFDQALLVLADRVGHWINTHRSHGFDEVRRQWLARAYNIGGQVQVRLPSETLTGTFADLDNDGALVLQAASGTRRIAAGDVFFPGSG